MAVFAADLWSLAYSRAAGALAVFAADLWSLAYSRAAGVLRRSPLIRGQQGTKRRAAFRKQPTRLVKAPRAATPVGPARWRPPRS
ncbi:hypothetical protein EXE43_26320, partial [Halorubrum sp. SS5]